MAQASAARTLGAIVIEVARIAGYLRSRGTATAGTTTTLTDANNERTPTADSTNVVGTFLYIDAGTSSGTARVITTYGTLGVFTWIQTATAPDATSTWARIARDPRDIIAKLDEVTRENARAFAQEFPFRSIVTGSLLGGYGGFEDWPDGTSSAPWGWTLGGAGAAVARQASIGHGVYSAGITPAAAVATLTLTIPFVTYRANAFADSGTMNLYGLVAPNAASDVVVRITVTNQTGTATDTNVTSTATGNRAQELDELTNADNISLGTNTATLAIQVRVVANASRADVEDLALMPTWPIYEYDLPPTLIGIAGDILMESGYRTNRYIHHLRRGYDWEVIRRPGSTYRTLRFDKALPTLRHLHINGLQAPAVQATTTSNLNMDADYAANAAALLLLREDAYRTKQQNDILDRLEAKVPKMHGSHNTISGRAAVYWIERI